MISAGAARQIFHHMKRLTQVSVAAFAASVALASALPLEGCRMPENVRKPPTPGASPVAEDVAATADSRAAAAADPLTVHRAAVAIDMHADTVQFIIDDGADISQRLTTTHLDAMRMKEGGLDAQFFSVWVEPESYGLKGARAVERADEQVPAVRALAERHPETWMLATSAADIRRRRRRESCGAHRL